MSVAGYSTIVSTWRVFPFSKYFQNLLYITEEIIVVCNIMIRLFKEYIPVFWRLNKSVRF